MASEPTLLPGEPDQGLLRLRTKLTHAVRSVCPSWLHEQSEDIVQEGLLRVMEIQSRSEEKRTFSSSYLWMTAYSAVVDEIRRRRRRREVGLNEMPEDRSASRVPGPERWAASEELGRGILRCLRDLIRPRRLAVTLYLRGCSTAETAVHLGWQEKKARNLIFRGREDLRRCLRRRGHEL